MRAEFFFPLPKPGPFGALKHTLRLFCLLCLLFLLLLALSPPAGARSLRFESLSEAPLNGESVQAIVQDRHGFIWFGSETGLSRYDGYQLTRFKNQTTGNAVEFSVSALHVDSDGQLWIGSKRGLFKFNQESETFTAFQAQGPRPRGHEHLQINTIIGDGKQGLWLGSNDGLQHFDIASKSFEFLRHDPLQPGSLINNQVNALSLDVDGNLWVGTNGGLDKYHVGKRHFEHYRLTQAGEVDPRRNSVQNLWLDKAQSLWIGTLAGLESWRFAKNEIVRRRFGPADGLSRGWITTLFQDADTNLWVGTFEGLHLWDANKSRFIVYRHKSSDPLSLENNRITAQFQDRSGTLWVGTWLSGVTRTDLASGGFSNLQLPGMRSGSKREVLLNAIISEPPNSLWLASNTGLWHYDLQGQEFSHYRLHENPRDDFDNSINDLLIHNQELWLATSKGLHVFDRNKKKFEQRWLPGNDSDSQFIRRIQRDNEGYFWLATQGGLFRYHPQSGRSQTYLHDPANESSLSDNFVRTLMQDRQGNIWVGTFGGLDKLDHASGKFTHFRHDPNNATSLSNDRITFLMQDRRGTIWIGTDTGLNRMDLGADGTIYFRPYFIHSEKPGPAFGALEGKFGNLWISTEKGISIFDPATARFRHFSGRDGTIEGSHVIGASHVSFDGTFYFGGENGGLTYFRHETIRGNPHQPQVVINNVRINQQAVKPGQEVDGFLIERPLHLLKSITLPYHHNTLSLEFAGLHYADPSNNRYAYQMQGVDKEWVLTDARNRRATYRNLEPGKYLFQVRAANKDGLWNETGANIQIVVRQPIWKTWWFIVLSSSMLILTAWSAYRSRIRNFTRQRRQLEEQVAVRTTEVIQQKQLVEQKNALVERQKREAEQKNELLLQQKYELERQKENVELAHHNISVLSEIGREITSTLDSDTIMRNVYRHVQSLLDATTFVIYLLDPEQKVLTIAFRVEYINQNLPTRIRLDDLADFGARCIREQREIALDFNGEEVHVEADKSHLACLYAPLATGNRVLGLMSIHARIEHAYTAREQLIFGTLCSYVAIALDNAAAYQQLGSTLQQLRATQAQMVQQEKMASLGTLTAGVAHEINNPANFAHVGAQALAADLERFREFLLELAGEDADQEVIGSLNQRIDQLSRQIDTIIEGTTRIKNLVLDLRTFSRLDQATKKTVAIGDSLLSTINLVRTQYAQVAEISCELQANPALECFPAELNQVFMNLIVNACQAIQNKHRKRGSKEKGLLSIRSRIAGDYLIIEFEDNGDGIPQAIIDHIFEPFFTTKSVGEGTGLGLSISFGIIEKHHGKITVKSTEGIGTCFTLQLPLVEQLES